MDSFTGIISSWVNKNYSLSNYTNGQVYLRFRIQSDWSQTADGIYIDDIAMTGINTNIPIYGDVTIDGRINIQDIAAINEYAIGLDPIIELDPRPWDTFRITNADVDNNGSIDSSIVICFEIHL